jgi:hypothetical protein
MLQYISGDLGVHHHQNKSEKKLPTLFQNQACVLLIIKKYQSKKYIIFFIKYKLLIINS